MKNKKVNINKTIFFLLASTKDLRLYKAIITHYIFNTDIQNNTKVMRY